MSEKRKRDIFEGAVIEGVDFEKGRKNFAGSVHEDVLRAWCKHTPASLYELGGLAKGLGDEDALKAYVTAAHGLKGSCYGICADDLGKAAAALEAAGRKGDLGYIADNNESFVKQAGLLHERLTKFFEEHAEEEGEKTQADSPDPVLLAELLAACKQFKSSAMEETLKKLESFEYASGGDLIPWLREQMDDLEYDAIVQRLSGG